ncbi:hypothetical protein [Mesorhizobium neociceri]|uniref:Uncharacterized protein n=1 Tax=Mesorhizobium neociceri TaxID=1307853 RepID=A0A838B6F8_9HYPH|nr:hypothetical protein [Mesorhizobium neociceri]MBA1141733.1 hypothetical protein [Mesorhizobium neociceri]
MTDIKDTPENMLRAWADAGVISSARFVEEMDRRAGRITIVAPPLDYALDDELSIQGVKLTMADFAEDDAAPMPPPAVKWIALIAAVLIIVCLAMVLPWKG